MLSRIPEKYLALITLCLWGAIILYSGGVRFDTFALDEGAAHALLLNWSLSDQVVNPIATYGGPDFRALLFIPLGIYWPGSIIAAKVFTIIIMFMAGLGLYYWSRGQQSAENALLAGGLLLIAPVTLQNVDHITIGPYLLLMFGLGTWIDRQYRHSAHAISSLYFTQCVLVAITVTLNPMGLAYPAALAWHWYKTPKSGKQQKQVWLGIAIAVIIVLVMQTGWIALQWLDNPAKSLDQAFWGYGIYPAMNDSYWFGYVLLAIFLGVVVFNAKAALSNLMGSMLLASSVIGLLVADMSWALVSTAVILYYGIALLIKLNQKISLHSFIGQRGLVMFIIFILATVFMLADKDHVRQIKSELLSSQDQLIATLAKVAEDKDQPFLAASQWPARTMIVCKRDVLHLPPAAASGEALLKSIKGVTHVMFDHRDPTNSQLAKNFAEVTSQTETLSIQDGGVIIKIKGAGKDKAGTKPVAKSIEKSNANGKTGVKDTPPASTTPTPE